MRKKLKKHFLNLQICIVRPQFCTNVAHLEENYLQSVDFKLFQSKAEFCDHDFWCESKLQVGDPRFAVSLLKLFLC